MLFDLLIFYRFYAALSLKDIGLWLPFLVRSWFIFRVGVILALQIELRRCFILNNRKIKIKFNEWLEFPFLILFVWFIIFTTFLS